MSFHRLLQTAPGAKQRSSASSSQGKNLLTMMIPPFVIPGPFILEARPRTSQSALFRRPRRTCEETGEPVAFLLAAKSLRAVPVALLLHEAEDFAASHLRIAFLFDGP